MSCKTHKKGMKKYADGGKVVKSEYGEPTLGRAVLANFGIGDGYGNPKNQPKPKAAEKPRMSISNAPESFQGVISKRKQMLDET
jgi:hypothetical protein